MCDLRMTTKHTVKMSLLACQVSTYLPFAEVRVQAIIHFRSDEQSLLETRRNFLGGLRPVGLGKAVPVPN